MSPTPKASDPLSRLKAATARLRELAMEQSELVTERSVTVGLLLDDGWSLSQIAAEVGVSKGAVQKMVR